MKQKILSSVGAFLAIAVFAIPGLTFAKNGFDNPRAVGSTLEVHVSDNGETVVRGAKVVSTSGDTITASTSFGSTVINWLVKTASSTTFVRRGSSLSSVSELTVGDFISFSGKLDTSASQLTVLAKVVKNWSLQDLQTVFSGTVQTVDPVQNLFTIFGKPFGTTTVKVASSTLITENATTVSFSAISVGDVVKAFGLYNNQTKILAAERVSIGAFKDNSIKLEKKNFQEAWKSFKNSIKNTFKKDKDNDD